MTTFHSIRCKCGKFEGRIAHPERSTRGICYCRDCRSYAHFLGPPEGMLDEHGGTDVTIVSPASVTFVRGTEHVACMSLSPNGTLRWFTSCCRTPIANSPRTIRVPHLGFVHSCLENGGPALDDAFGPVTMKVNRHSAHGNPGRSPALPFLMAAVGYAVRMAASRIGGGYRKNPFFDARTGAPIVAPQVLTRAEREALLKRT
jgi:hypothetical protein